MLHTVPLSQFNRPQKDIMRSMLAGHRAMLQFSPVTGKFTGYVRIFNVSLACKEIIPWYRILAMLDRGLIRMNGLSIETSTELVCIVRIKA